MVLTHFPPFSKDNFNSSYLLSKLTNWLQLGLILMSRRSSLKGAQVEICSVIRSGATSLPNWYHFQKNGKNAYNFARLYLLNELTYRHQLELILMSNTELQCFLRWVGRGVQPPSTPQPQPPVHILRDPFSTFQLNHYGFMVYWSMDQWTDGQSSL